ncbi:pyruvate kinase [Pseudobacteriovorax antillogorgiicola]|uniref:Pyruvate kinase n=1 Tax=Pseudobacteriovorax antillogorgiicola TaxID=1513793 RepID=A0A1Y6BNJ8_9BACT|nr:pyruvate kinase [Pseudobacteriovorax antillogorgiicola]TCS53875.1 pyruvate kinase [Pseudobacteriovorax antillogorgiicola]SMF21240.1 pyruvate kinase [Pseudobacteriovorax antillogorgiicola]
MSNTTSTSEGTYEPNLVRHTKIIGTLGPSSSDYETQKKLVEAGLNIARLNFSHGDHATHLKNIHSIRQIAQETGKPVAILQDLQGPKIRVGKLMGDQMQIVKGETYSLRYGVEQKEAKVIPIDYRGLTHDVSKGQRVMMDDGLLILEVTDVKHDTVHVTVQEGGTLKNRKGVNFPDSKLSLPAMTDKDSKDLLFGIANNVDYVALSFVQDPADIRQIKSMIRALGSDVPVVAKIEKLPAIDTIDEIAQEADGLMVARGDLGVEANVERVPNLQRTIIRAATKHGKPVIIATQMLESMIKNPRASLAEVADVANGVLDGADCLMLSGEVASGRYPVQAVKRMSDIIKEVEAWTFKRPSRFSLQERPSRKDWEVNESIALSACEAADALNAKAIVCLTLTGSIARSISKWRPKTPIIAISPRKDVSQRLEMVWGIQGIPNPSFYNTDSLLQELPRVLKELNVAESGDVVVITAGIPINKMKPTNMIKINRIP